MENKCKVLFAYPVVYKEDMKNEDMCIPSAFFTEFLPYKKQSIVITAAYSIDYGQRCYILLNVDKVGDVKDYQNVIENGRAHTLKGGVFDGNMGVYVTSFFMHDFYVKDTGFYEIQIQIFKADESGNKTDIVFDLFKSQFWVQVREEQA